MVGDQGDKIDVILIKQQEVVQNAEQANVELDEAKEYQNKKTQKTIMFLLVLIALASLLIIIFYKKLF